MQLVEQCLLKGGEPYESGLGYDVKFRFADENFPAECKLLFHRSVETYLDMESLGMLGTMLGKLLVA